VTALFKKTRQHNIANKSIYQMAKHIIKAINDGQLRPNRVQTLSGLVDFISENYTYDTENAILFPKGQTEVYLKVIDLCVALSAQNVEVTEQKLGTACTASKVPKTSTIERKFKELPEWDGVDHIEKLSSYFSTDDSEMFTVMFKFWLTNAVGMILEPLNISAVNRLVFCVQSEKQRIGKTSVARWLAEPFKTSYSSAIIEYDNPANDKDSKIELTKNCIAVLEDIDSWSSRKIESLKSMISAKEIKARIPYAKNSTNEPRRASYFATTNQTGFLNESGNTRWVIFSLEDIDWKGYRDAIDPINVWSQAKDYWCANSTHKYLTDEQIEYCKQTSENFQINPEFGEIVYQYVGYLENGRLTASMIYEAMSDTHRRLLGAPNAALGKIGKALRRRFGEDIAYRTKDARYYKLRLIKAERDLPF
jgi:predicted P-loop ATPase